MHAERCLSARKCEAATHARIWLDKGDPNDKRVSGKYAVEFGGQHLEGRFLFKYRKDKDRLDLRMISILQIHPGNLRPELSGLLLMPAIARAMSLCAASSRASIGWAYFSNAERYSTATYTRMSGITPDSWESPTHRLHRISGMDNRNPGQASGGSKLAASREDLR